MSEIKWQDPTSSQRDRYAEIETALRSRPNEWALIKESAYASLGTYAKKRLGAGFEVTSRGASGGGFNIYARYVGEAQS